MTDAKAAREHYQLSSFPEERVCCEGFSTTLPCLTQPFVRCIAICFSSFKCYCAYFLFIECPCSPGKRRGELPGRMSAGDERLQAFGENRPREERLFISQCQQEPQKRATWWKKHCLHYISCDVFVSYTFSFNLSLYCQYCSISELPIQSSLRHTMI